MSFNPSGNPAVNLIKILVAETIDELYNLRESSTSGEAKAAYTLAIRKLQEGQMWGVKAITWVD
jgi:hypothetical protein